MAQKFYVDETGTAGNMSNSFKSGEGSQAAQNNQ